MVRKENLLSLFSFCICPIYVKYSLSGCVWFFFHILRFSFFLSCFGNTILIFKLGFLYVWLVFIRLDFHFFYVCVCFSFKLLSLLYISLNKNHKKKQQLFPSMFSCPFCFVLFLSLARKIVSFSFSFYFRNANKTQ